jgi:hypothetical protein
MKLGMLSELNVNKSMIFLNGVGKHCASSVHSVVGYILGLPHMFLLWIILFFLLRFAINLKGEKY